jgi:hypothetical protein
VGRAGLALSVFFPLRFMHPRLVIPWTAVERCDKKKFLFFSCAEITVSGFNRIIILNGGAGQKAMAVWGKLSGLPAAVPYERPKPTTSSGGFGF